MVAATDENGLGVTAVTHDGGDVALRIGRRDHPIGGSVNGDHGGVGIDVLDGIDHRVPLRDLRRGAAEGGHDPVVAMRGRIGHVEWTGERDDPRRAKQRPRTDLVVVQFVPGAAPDRELRSGTVPDNQLVVVDRQFPQIDTDDELIVGHSAGAQLAVWGGTRHKLEDDEVGARPLFRPTRVVSLAGPLDMTYAATHGDDRIVTALGGTPAQVPQRYTMVDPIQNIDPDTPVVAVHGTADRMVSPANSQRYAAAVVKAGGDAEAVLIPGGNHGSVVTSNAPEYPRVLDIITGASAADVQDVA